jgi:hypothetical protein
VGRLDSWHRLDGTNPAADNQELRQSINFGTSSAITIDLQIQGWDLVPSIVGGILLGCTVGVLNGALVVITKASRFLITLGTQTLVYPFPGADIAKTWYGTIRFQHHQARQAI